VNLTPPRINWMDSHFDNNGSMQAKRSIQASIQGFCHEKKWRERRELQFLIRTREH
jgi:hypothetical protein